MSTITVL